MSESPVRSGRGGTRQQTHEIVIDAPIEAVWKAISDGEELTRWFVDEATVTPGLGGTISIQSSPGLGTTVTVRLPIRREGSSIS